LIHEAIPDKEICKKATQPIKRAPHQSFNSEESSSEHGHEKTGVMTPPKTSTLIQFASSIVLKIEANLTYAQKMP
jgi:hypothetical protein